MKTFPRWLQVLLRLLTYILVALLAAAVTFFLCLRPGMLGGDKLDALSQVIHTYFIGEVDDTAMEDAAAAAMVDALGDRWSYYIPASEYQSYTESVTNAYVGIGITITNTEDGAGFEVLKLEPGGPAYEGGVLPGDIVTHVEGQSVAQLGQDGARELIRGEEGTVVKITVLRDGQSLELELKRSAIQVEVARGEMLEGNVGLVTINNFSERCAQETIAAIEQLLQQGAQALIFDVRFNPGGYQHELVELLDYLLPKGVLFRSVNYAGVESVDRSDANCLELPMAVLLNADSYSAAEFFAAALSEYEWAELVGQASTGKGYFQNAIQLGDGSAVNLSVGKYYTPNGVSLAEVGGLVPDVEVPVDDETAALIYSDLLEPMEDPQVLAALEALKVQ